MEYEEHQERVEEYFGINENVIIDIPDINTQALYGALYTMAELDLWPDDVTVSLEQALMCWTVVEKIKKDGFPIELGM